jgi:transitional endoplasmic reticulum ATPase
MPLDPKVDLGELAEKAEGFAGSDLKALTQEAGIIALREDENAKQVKLKHFLAALESVHPTISEDMREWYDKITETLHKRPKLESELNTNIM